MQHSIILNVNLGKEKKFGKKWEMYIWYIPDRLRKRMIPVCFFPFRAPMKQAKHLTLGK